MVLPNVLVMRQNNGQQSVGQAKSPIAEDLGFKTLMIYQNLWEKWEWECLVGSPVGSQESLVGSQESPVGSQESLVGSPGSPVGRHQERSPVENPSPAEKHQGRSPRGGSPVENPSPAEKHQEGRPVENPEEKFMVKYKFIVMVQFNFDLFR